jgi:hypothetical protein
MAAIALARVADSESMRGAHSNNAQQSEKHNHRERVRVMARKAKVPAGGMSFTDETAVPSNQGRKTDIPPALLEAVRSTDAKSYVVNTEDEAKDFRALVRQAAGLIGRQSGNPKAFGAKTAAVRQEDGTWRVYFAGRVKAVDEADEAEGNGEE